MFYDIRSGSFLLYQENYPIKMVSTDSMQSNRLSTLSHYLFVLVSLYILSNQVVFAFHVDNVCQVQMILREFLIDSLQYCIRSFERLYPIS